MSGTSETANEHGLAGLEWKTAFPHGSHDLSLSPHTPSKILDMSPSGTASSKLCKSTSCINSSPFLGSGIRLAVGFISPLCHTSTNRLRIRVFFSVRRSVSSWIVCWSQEVLTSIITTINLYVVCCVGDEYSHMHRICATGKTSVILDTAQTCVCLHLGVWNDVRKRSLSLLLWVHLLHIP